MHRDNAPDVSVLVANYNGAGVIGPCLASVFDQKTSVLFEVIVHDDASSDNSRIEIRNGYPQATLIESNENAGFCVSNNRMVKKALGEFLLLLNNDTVLEPTTLEALHLYAQHVQCPAILGLPQHDAQTRSLIDAGYHLDPFFNPIPNKTVTRNPVAYVPGSLLWIPRKLWDEIGGFPSWFGSIAEDMFLCQAARLLGYATYVLPDPPYYHHVGHSFGGGKPAAGRLRTSVLRRSLSERNKTLVMIIVAPVIYLVCVLLPHLFLLLIEGLMISIVRRKLSLFTKIYLQAVGSTLRDFPKAWRVRRYLARTKGNQPQSNAQLGFLSQIRWRLQKVSLLWKYGAPYFNR